MRAALVPVEWLCMGSTWYHGLQAHGVRTADPAGSDMARMHGCVPAACMAAATHHQREYKVLGAALQLSTSHSNQIPWYKAARSNSACMRRCYEHERLQHVAATHRRSRQGPLTGCTRIGLWAGRGWSAGPARSPGFLRAAVCRRPQPWSSCTQLLCCVGGSHDGLVRWALPAYRAPNC